MEVLRTQDARFARLPEFSFAPHFVEGLRDVDGAKLSRRARDFWRNEWPGQRFMAIGAKDPVLVLLLLGTGHCFRDQVLNACPSLNRSSATLGTIQKTVAGSSLETACSDAISVMRLRRRARCGGRDYGQDRCKS